jgi:hypothetical protein
MYNGTLFSALALDSGFSSCHPCNGAACSGIRRTGEGSSLHSPLRVIIFAMILFISRSLQVVDQIAGTRIRRKLAQRS